MTRVVQQLAREAAEAAEMRVWRDHPDVVALRVERVRTLVDRMMWTGIVLGLLFTMVNVQQFAAHTVDAEPGSLGWWAAWLLDPTVAVILLGILVAERRVAPAQIRLGQWSRIAKWSLLAATYVMNTWQSWASGSPAGIVLHSVPPLVVFMAAESVTDCQDKLTAYVQWAHNAAARRVTERAAIEQRKALEHASVQATADDAALATARRAELETARHEAELETIRRASQPPVDATPAPAVTPLPTRRKTRSRSTADERRTWIEQQIRGGRDVTGADVKTEFPDASNAARDVTAVRARLTQEQADRRGSVHMVKGGH
jgi:hypothetical protein